MKNVLTLIFLITLCVQVLSKKISQKSDPSSNLVKVVNENRQAFRTVSDAIRDFVTYVFTKEMKPGVKGFLIEDATKILDLHNLRKPFKNVSDEQVREMFVNNDVDKNGEISREEFTSFLFDYLVNSVVRQ